MVWGGFAAHAVGNLYRVEGIMDQYNYHYLLVYQLKPSITHLFPERNYIFQQTMTQNIQQEITKGIYDILEYLPLVAGTIT